MRPAVVWRPVTKCISNVVNGTECFLLSAALAISLTALGSSEWSWSKVFMQIPSSFAVSVKDTFGLSIEITVNFLVVGSLTIYILPADLRHLRISSCTFGSWECSLGPPIWSRTAFQWVWLHVLLPILGLYVFHHGQGWRNFPISALMHHFLYMRCQSNYPIFTRDVDTAFPLSGDKKSHNSMRD